MTQTLIVREQGEPISPQLKPALDGTPIRLIPTAGGTASVGETIIGSGFDNAGYGFSYFAPHHGLLTRVEQDTADPYEGRMESRWTVFDASNSAFISLGSNRLSGAVDRYLSGVSDRSSEIDAYVTDGLSEQIFIGNLGQLWHAGVNITPTFERMELYRQARRAETDSRLGALSDIRREIASETARFALQAPKDVVIALTRGAGVGQILIARAVGVTPTAVRKWRRGEPARPEHRARLAALAALLSVLDGTSTHNPASWLDVPIASESLLTPLDLAIAGRADLVVLHARRLLSPFETLDEFDLQWRSEFGADPDYKVVRLPDGSRAVVPR